MSEFLHPSLKLTSKQSRLFTLCMYPVHCVLTQENSGVRSPLLLDFLQGPGVCAPRLHACVLEPDGESGRVCCYSLSDCSWAHCCGRGILGTAGPLLASAVPLRSPPPASPTTLTECEAWLVRVLCLNALCFPWT